MARLLSVNVGLPRDVSWQGERVFTSVWKEPVQGSRMVRRLNVDGDGQGDLSGHGGEHRAVLVYQMDSYRYWEQQLGRTNFTFGQFGENFTVEGLPDGEVCIGDRYRIGGALFEVTQPRVTCYRVGIRMDEPRDARTRLWHPYSRRSRDDNCDQRGAGSRISTLRLRGTIRERARGRQGVAGRTSRTPSDSNRRCLCAMVRHLLMDGLSMGVDRRPVNVQCQASPISPAAAQILSKKAVSSTG